LSRGAGAPGQTLHKQLADSARVGPRPAYGERRVSTYAGSRARIRCPPAPNRRARQRLRRPLPVPTSGDWLATWLSGKDRATGSGHNACFGKLVRRSDGDRAPGVADSMSACAEPLSPTHNERQPRRFSHSHPRTRHQCDAGGQDGSVARDQLRPPPSLRTSRAWTGIIGAGRSCTARTISALVRCARIEPI
jgi:hypothetical protein